MQRAGYGYATPARPPSAAPPGRGRLAGSIMMRVAGVNAVPGVAPGLRRVYACGAGTGWIWYGVMPTVLRSGPYRFFFYSGDRNEPPHVHVERDDRSGKFWLDPVRIQESGGLSRGDIQRIIRLVEAHQATLIGAWNDYFDN